MVTLNKEETTYSKLFKMTKFSHITLQSSLKGLLERNFIQRIDIGYKITNKGKILLEKLEEIKELTRK